MHHRDDRRGIDSARQECSERDVGDHLPGYCGLEVPLECIDRFLGRKLERIGDACLGNPDCNITGFSAFCQTALPGGYCTAFCTDGLCPNGSTCALDFDFTCAKNCTSNTDCREPDYVCRPLFDPTEQTFMGCAPPGP